MARVRLDLFLVQRGDVPSRERASALILANSVLVNDMPVTKPGTPIDPEKVTVRIREGALDPYVSRGAHKLIAALDAFSVNPEGSRAVDLGASTGGFTQVLLERGAQRVVSVDVGQAQLHERLRQDQRVRNVEKCNARTVTLADLQESPFDLVVGDLSFISLSKILPAAVELGTDRADFIFLIKPQFEVGRERIEKGGIVRDPLAHQAAVDQVLQEAKSVHLSARGWIESPLRGTDGNKEFLVHFVRIQRVQSIQEGGADGT